MRIACRSAVLLTLLAAAFPRGSAAELFRLEMRGGSILSCEILEPAALVMLAPGGSRSVAWNSVKAVHFAQRSDPNKANQALVAVGDLASDYFTTRESADQLLRSLGESARPALGMALHSSDFEMAFRARSILRRLGDSRDPGDGDGVRLADGTMLSGTLALDDVTVVTRWRRFRIPVESIALIEAQPAGTVAISALVRSGPIADTQVFADAPVRENVCREWDQNLSAGAPIIARKTDHWRLAFDQLPVRGADGQITWKKSKPGENLEQAFAPLGIIFRPMQFGAACEVSEEAVRGGAGGLSARVRNSDIEILFSDPNASPAAPSLRRFGVLDIAAVFKITAGGGIELAAFDENGRNIGTVRREPITEPQLPFPGLQSDLFGLSSSVPITRLRIRRYGAMKTANADLAFSDLVVGPLVPAVAASEHSRLYLKSSEMLTGRLRASPPGSISFAPNFLGDEAPPMTLKFAEIRGYEPARGNPVKNDKTSVPAIRIFHEVTLRNGEHFRANLKQITEHEALFELGSAAVLTLPREALRKVVLFKAKPRDPSLPEPAPSADADKPGVELRTKADLGETAVPQATGEVADPKNNPAQGLARLDNVEIISYVSSAREITLRDENGEFTFDILGVKALIFPPGPAAKAQISDWILTLRDGTKFDAALVAVAPDSVTLEIAGGKVVMPSERIESLFRK